MAQKTVVTVVCDLPHDDEVEGRETVAFSFDGTSYEIDVCTSHAKELHDKFSEYTDSARKVSGGGGRPPPDASWSRPGAERGNQGMGKGARTQGKRARSYSRRRSSRNTRPATRLRTARGGRAACPRPGLRPLRAAASPAPVLQCTPRRAAAKHVPGGQRVPPPVRPLAAAHPGAVRRRVQLRTAPPAFAPGVPGNMVLLP